MLIVPPVAGQTKPDLKRQGAKVVDGFTHKYEDVNGVKLHYVIGGKGDPVVLLHGWPQTWYEWRHAMPELAKKYTVIAVDMRGLGDSSRPDAGYDKKTVSEDVYQLTKKLGYDKVSLVGHDVGSMVAYSYAARHPEGVKRLILSEVLLPGFGLEEKMDVSKGGYWHFGFHMAEGVPELLVEGKERKYLTMMAYQGAAHKKDAITDGDIAEFVRCYASPGGMKAGFNYYRAMLQDGKDNREFAKTKLKMPVLVLGGDKSPIPLKSLLDGVTQVADDVSNDAIKGAGHWIAEENPEDFASKVMSFLAK